jgi:hypothetical protein
LGINLAVSQNSLTVFGYLVGNGPSPEQSFVVTGSGLTNNPIVTVSDAAHYEISTGTGAGFSGSSSLTFVQVGGKVSSTVYVRLKAGLTSKVYGTESITVAHNGTTYQTVTTYGKVLASPLITATSPGSPACVGGSVSLRSTGPDIDSRYWIGPNNYYSVDSVNTLATNNATSALSGDYIVTGNAIVGGNLIFNGDFEQGNIGFGSSYGYSSNLATGGSAPYYGESLYYVTANPQSVHNGFTSCADHSTTGTKQMVINGATVPGVVGGTGHYQ